MSYDNAFGGTDERMRDPAKVRSYLPNPVGRGWHHHVYPELVSGAPVSNTEEIRDPVRDPGGNYRPMAFGPIGRGWPSRIGTPGHTISIGPTTSSRSCRRISTRGISSARRRTSRCRISAAASR